MNDIIRHFAFCSFFAPFMQVVCAISDYQMFAGVNVCWYACGVSRGVSVCLRAIRIIPIGLLGIDV